MASLTYIQQVFRFHYFLLHLSVVNKLLSPHNLQPSFGTYKQFNRIEA